MDNFIDLFVIIAFFSGAIIMWFLHIRSLNHLRVSNDDLIERIKMYEIEIAELKRIKQNVLVEKAEVVTELKFKNEKILEQEEFKEKLFELQAMLLKTNNN
ncbi:MAG: hypothetical protein DRI86_06180 [Bacteroidetes bacterium]|nr:MAG: hypothetical protein DRI86_06180 [Bacteroidota bacterium]